MPLKIGILCSQAGRALASVIELVQSGQIPVEICLVIADRDSDALLLARQAGFFGAFIPRAAFHANQDGYERRLVEMFREAQADAVVLAEFERDIGPVMKEAFPNRIFGQKLDPEELVEDLQKHWRSALFHTV